MTREKIQELYDKLELFLDNEELTPMHDNLINQLTKLSEKLDKFDSQLIDEDSQKMINNLKNPVLDSLVKESMSDLESISDNVSKVAKLVNSVSKIIEKLT